MRENTTVSLGGMITEYRERTTKSGDKMAFCWLEDPDGRIELIVRAKELVTYREVLTSEQPILITGSVRYDRERGSSNQFDENGSETPVATKMLLNEACVLLESFSQRAKSICVKVEVSRLDRSKLVALREVLQQYPGACPVTLELSSSPEWTVTMVARGLMVDPCTILMSRLEHLFGEKVCEIR